MLRPMLRIFHKRHPPVGASPGTLMVDGSRALPRVRMFRYDEVSCDDEQNITDVERLRVALEPGRSTWIDVQGLGDEPMLRRIGEMFSIHPLALEDLVNAPQRPKAEAYADQMLLITRMARIESDGELDVEQVGVIIGASYVLTFQEHHGDVFDPVRQRLRNGKGPIRTAGPGYLAYALIDTIIDGYYPIIERISERLERLETRVIQNPTPRTLETLNKVKVLLVVIRRGLWPQRDAITQLIKEPSPLITEQVRIYLRDTYDHCAQLVDVIDSQRELINSMMNTYLSVTGNRTNEVMKVLTITSSIFIPLTFVAGVYGMNFEHMPELHARWSYPLVMIFMAVVAGALLAYFRRKGWLGRQPDDDDDDDIGGDLGH